MRNTIILLLLIAFVPISCGENKQIPVPMFVVAKIINNTKLPCPIKLFVNGKEMVSMPTGLKGLEKVELGEIKGIQPRASLAGIWKIELKMLGPDGWADDIVDMGEDSGKDLLSDGLQGWDETNKRCQVSLCIELSLKSPTDLFLYDNRGGKESLFTMGQASFRIPANQSGSFMFPIARQPENAVVRLDGTEAGSTLLLKELGSTEKDSQALYLVDTSGNRKYQERMVAYDISPFDAGSQPKPTIHENKKLYLIGINKFGCWEGIDFLTPAPGIIETSSVRVYHTEIIEITK